MRPPEHYWQCPLRSRGEIWESFDRKVDEPLGKDFTFFIQTCLRGARGYARTNQREHQSQLVLCRTSDSSTPQVDLLELWEFLAFRLFRWNGDIQLPPATPPQCNHFEVSPSPSPFQADTQMISSRFFNRNLLGSEGEPLSHPVLAATCSLGSSSLSGNFLGLQVGGTGLTMHCPHLDSSSQPRAPAL